jgi:flavin reductase (DIM6/NTAB) family NADH-FMN oxidoreductase RutF
VSFRSIAASSLSPRDAYFMLIDTIVPRPIAWVLTRSLDGIPNLAPFSFFSGVTGRPPTLVLSFSPRIDRDPDGTRSVREKDTLANLRATSQMIVHVAPRSRRAQVVASSDELPPRVTELTDLGFGEPVPGTWVDVPRLPELPVAMECRLDRIIPVGDPATHLVLGEVLGWHIREDLIREGRVPSASWEPLARLGVEGYQD